MAILVFFPEAFIELQKEIINNHPKLSERLAKHHDTDAELQFAKCIAEICSYVGIALDDTYTQEMLIEIADLCIWRLRARNAPMIFSKPQVVDSPILDRFGKPIVVH